MTVGAMAGQWCPHGLDPDLPGDQRAEAGGSLVFDSPPLEESIDLLGAAQLSVTISSDKPVANIAAVLSEVLEDGGVTRVSYGLLNLTHRNNHEVPEPLEPGKEYEVQIQLCEAGHRFVVGNCIRVALSTSYWPIAWPAPEKATITLTAGAGSLALPIRPERAADFELRQFEEAEGAEPLRKTISRGPDYQWEIKTDMKNGVVTEHQWFDEGRVTYDCLLYTSPSPRDRG